MRSEQGLPEKNMRKMNFVIREETEEQFRKAIANRMGVRKGNISKALEEAIYLWIEQVSNISREPPGKAIIGWSGKDSIDMS
jgi:hypothetical protein